MKKYIIRLSEEERQSLLDVVRTCKAAAYKRMHAQVFLKACGIAGYHHLSGNFCNADYPDV